MGEHRPGSTAAIEAERANRAEARATRAEAALVDIVRADIAKWQSRGAPAQSFALTEAIERARSVLASSGPGDGTPDA